MAKLKGQKPKFYVVKDNFGVVWYRTKSRTKAVQKAKQFMKKIPPLKGEIFFG